MNNDNQDKTTNNKAQNESNIRTAIIIKNFRLINKYE